MAPSTARSPILVPLRPDPYLVLQPPVPFERHPASAYLRTLRSTPVPASHGQGALSGRGAYRPARRSARLLGAHLPPRPVDPRRSEREVRTVDREPGHLGGSEGCSASRTTRAHGDRGLPGGRGRAASPKERSPTGSCPVAGADRSLAQGSERPEAQGAARSGASPGAGSRVRRPPRSASGTSIPPRGRLRVAEREIALGRSERARLRVWIAHRGHRPGALFVPINKAGRLSRRPMSAEAVAQVVRKRAAEAGLGALSPQDLRRAHRAKIRRT